MIRISKKEAKDLKENKMGYYVIPTHSRYTHYYAVEIRCVIDFLEKLRRTHTVYAV